MPVSQYTSDHIDRAVQRARLDDALREEITPEQKERLERFLELRAKWSETHNLSGPRALERLSTDIADSIAVWSCLDLERPLIDIGSGSGAPGLMVACLEPELEIHLVEPLAKRCAFMKTAAYRLGLERVTVHRGRWPHAELDELEAFIPISRAVVSPEEWPHLAHRPNAVGIMQMLAHQRPRWPLSDYTLDQEVSYLDPEGGERVVRRWTKRRDA